MAKYGIGNDETIITEYLDSHLENGIKQKNLDFVLDLIDDYVELVEEIAEKYNIPTTLLCDTNHILYSDYSEVIVVGAGADAVDYKLIGLCHKGDIVVSQDYGVAAMALGKPVTSRFCAFTTEYNA